MYMQRNPDYTERSEDIMKIKRNLDQEECGSFSVANSAALIACDLASSRLRSMVSGTSGRRSTPIVGSRQTSIHCDPAAVGLHSLGNLFSRGFVGAACADKQHDRVSIELGDMAYKPVRLRAALLFR